MVWESLIDGQYEVFLHKKGAGTTTQLTGSDYGNTGVLLSGFNIAWLGGREDNPFTEVFLYSILSKTTTQLTDSATTRNNHGLDISGNEIVWCSFDLIPRQTFIFHYDRTAMTITELPALLISEESVIDVPSGLGEFFKSTRIDAYTQSVILHKMLDINVKITIGAQDEESFSLLSESLGLIFGTLRQIVGSSIQSTTPGLRWEVTLPLRATLPATPNGVQVADSVVDKVWVGDLSLEKVRFEGFSQIEYTLGKLQPDPVASGITLHPDAHVWDDFPVRIIAPVIGKVGQAIHLQIDRRRPQSRVYIDNPDVAYIDPESLILRPKRVGEVTIYVVGASYVTGMAGGIHASHTLRIVY